MSGTPGGTPAESAPDMGFGRSSLPSRTCFLHVGASKTGSTSIQEALFFDLRHPRFQYIGGGLPNGSFALNCAFDPSPENEWTFHALGAGGPFASYRDGFVRRIERGLRRARRSGRHAILSSEATWISSAAGQRNLRARLEAEGLEVRVIAYLRPWIPWVDSLFQEVVKGGRGQLVLGHKTEGRTLRVRERLSGLFEVFGRDRVAVSLFEPRTFPEGCVVRHFCGQIGLPAPAGRSWRSNEGLSLEGVRLRYAFNRFAGPEGEYARPKPPGIGRLLRRLQALDGPPVALHSSLTRPWLDALRADDAWIERELGFSLSDPVGPRADPENAVATEADLFRFPARTREWLAERVGRPVVRLADGEPAARGIAEQVDLLRRRPRTPSEVREDFLEKVRIAAVRWMDAC